MQELTISLNPKDQKPLYEQIYHYIKESIAGGQISCHEKLPSTRRLSKFLEVSRSTVELAYEQLLSEGYIESEPYRGFYVTDIEGLYRLEGQKREREIHEETAPKYAYDFTPNGMDLKSFPYNAWRRLAREALIDDDVELFRLGDPQGEVGFRESIAKYLYESRGIICSAEQVIVGAGSDFLLMVLCMVLGRDHVIAVENPTYRQAYRMFTAQSYKVEPVAVDRYGMNIELLRSSGADVAYVTPSHQFPTGIVMPMKRRIALLKWAEEEENRYIIEDDYDSEFRYKGKPIPALAGQDTSGRVVYLGTFSKSIAPSIRMSYMVLPEALLGVYQEKCRFISSTVSKVDQRIVRHFIDEGYYERNLNRIRTMYKGRHDLLIKKLAPLAPYAAISGEYSGVHLLLSFLPHVSEERLVEAAKEAQIRVYGISDYIIGDNRYLPTILLGFAILSEEEIKTATELLCSVWLPIIKEPK